VDRPTRAGPGVPVRRPGPVDRRPGIAAILTTSGSVAARLSAMGCLPGWATRRCSARWTRRWVAAPQRDSGTDGDGKNL